MSYSLDKSKIKILLLEGVHQNAIDNFLAQGYTNIESLPHALPENELIEKIKEVHLIGVRSRTKLTKNVLQHAKKLIASGCFCIGTNQTDLQATKDFGIPVFNAPFSNTRSVAELIMAEIVMLMRGIPQKSVAAHRGQWIKSAQKAYEVRGKNLGIIGYGHIGTQTGVLAEAFGMKVYYYDVVNKLPIGNANQLSSLSELLQIADVITLHVPETPQTKYMIGSAELAQMKKGSYLLNASRGTVVEIEALVEALEKEHLLGAAIDVFPTEPKSNDEEFISPLRPYENVILTPHIGGSTKEAQSNIGKEVSDKLIKYSDNGSTLSSVNFVEVDLPQQANAHRILHIHKNVPGVLSAINKVFSEKSINIEAQYLQTDPDIGYVVIDIAKGGNSQELLQALLKIEGTIRGRVLY